MSVYNDVLIIFRKNNFYSQSYSTKELSKKCDTSETSLDFFFNLSLLNGFITEPFKNIRFVKCLNHKDLNTIGHLIDNSEMDFHPITTDIREEKVSQIKSILEKQKTNFLLLINRYEINKDIKKKTHIHAIFYSLFDDEIHKIKDGIIYFEKKKLVSPNKLFKKYTKVRKNIARFIIMIVDEKKFIKMIMEDQKNNEYTFNKLI